MFFVAAAFLGGPAGAAPRTRILAKAACGAKWKPCVRGKAPHAGVSILDLLLGPSR
jgi:hypothetical protein